MNDFTWILCSRDNKTEWWQRGWMGKIIKSLYLSLFAKPKMYKVYSAEDKLTEGYLIRIPWSKKELQGIGRSSIVHLVRKIQKLIKGSNITRVYPEPCLMESVEFRDELSKKGTHCLACGYDVFVSLTEHMLRHIAEKKRKSIGRLEIAIIAGKDLEALKTLILKMAGSIGLVTIAGEFAGNHSEELETWLEGICDDTGLCIRTTPNIINALKDCDIVISFEKKSEYKRYEDKPVIWFGDKESHITKNYEFYPYRIEIDFPAILYNHYTQELVSCFGSLGIAEVFLDSEINTKTTAGNIINFPEIERINLLKQKLYEKMEEIRYIRKPLE